MDLFEGEIKIYEERTRKGTPKRLRITKLYGQRYLDKELTLKKEELEA